MVLRLVRRAALRQAVVGPPAGGSDGSRRGAGSRLFRAALPAGGLVPLLRRILFKVSPERPPWRGSGHGRLSRGIPLHPGAVARGGSSSRRFRSSAGRAFPPKIQSHKGRGAELLGGAGAAASRRSLRSFLGGRQVVHGDAEAVAGIAQARLVVELPHADRPVLSDDAHRGPVLLSQGGITRVDLG